MFTARLVCIIALAACTAPTAVPQGLDIRESSADRLVASFADDDLLVTVETRATRDGTDLRYLDGDGVPFYLQRAGDTFADPTWTDDLPAALARSRSPDSELALAGRLAGELGLAKPSTRTQPAVAAAIGTSWSGWAGWYYLDGEMYVGDEYCFLNTCYAEHAAVNMWVESGGKTPYWSLVIVACNHGRCPNGAGMQFRAVTLSNGWIFDPTLSGENDTQMPTKSVVVGANGGCLTNAADAFDVWGWEHSANDDALYELFQIKYGGVNTPLGNGYTFAATNDLRHYACNCGASGCDNTQWAPYAP